MRFSERRTHERTLHWAERVAAGEWEDAYGIMGKSCFFNVPGFDVIQDILPETMHLMDGGFMKNTCGRTFHNGPGAQTRPGYRRTSIARLSELIR